MRLVNSFGVLHVMKLEVILLVLSLFFIGLSLFVVGDGGSFWVSNGTNMTAGSHWSPDCSGTLSTTLDVDYPIYGDINAPELIEVKYLDEYGVSIEVGGTQVALYLNSSWYNFTYTNSTDTWWLYLMDSSSENFDFNVSAYAPSYLCVNVSGMIKFRTPFYLTFHFYKAKDATDMDVEEYKNEFQFIVLQNYTQVNQMNTFADLHYLDTWFGWMPFYTKGKIGRKVNTDVSFWSEYENGQAIIKLYETGNYSINMLTSNVHGLEWSKEFIFPQFDPDWNLQRLQTGLIISNTSSKTVNVYATLWEINKMRLVRDYAFWIVALVIYCGLMFLLISSGVGSWQAYIGFTIIYYLILKMIGWVFL
jgi:hypothetical protein